MGKIECQDKRHGLRGHASIYDVNFRMMAHAMITATANHQAISSFRIAHSERVKGLATTLANRSDMKVDSVKLGIICDIHDMYEYVTTEKHGKLAAKFLQTFVDEYYPQLSGDKVEWLKAVEAVKLHSHKGVSTSNPYLMLLQDADVLDKISIGYIEAWYNTFQANDIKEVVNVMVEKVRRYEGRTPAYSEIRQELSDKLTQYNTTF